LERNGAAIVAQFSEIPDEVPPCITAGMVGCKYDAVRRFQLGLYTGLQRMIEAQANFIAT
jgi:hypothetical protein